MNRFFLLLLIVAGCVAVQSLAIHSVRAQEANDQAAAVDPGPQTSTDAEQSYFMWVVKSSGFIGLVILGISLYFVATVVMLFLELRFERVSPPDVIQQCTELINQREFRALYEFARTEGSFLSTVLATGIAELSHGLPEAREAMERVGDAETVEMEKRISPLAVIGTLGPMIGLLGTLKGMISSFSVIAMSGVTLKASEVAGGISEALLLTFEGVALSVPAIWFFAVFRNRVSHLSVSTTLQADEIIRVLWHALKGKQTPRAPTAATQA